MPQHLSLAEARRIALAAQGLAGPRPVRQAGARDLARTIARLGLLQIDAVNVLARAHYVPIYSRLGSYDCALLDEAAYGPRRTLFEYWGHEASLIPLALHPLMRWRMARAQAGEGIYGSLAAFGRERGPFVDAVLDEVRRRGPLAGGDLAMGERGRGSWWGWSEAKRALEWLFWAGLVTVATRRGFERLYDLPERVLPRAELDASTPSPEEARRGLLRHAARPLGVATERDLRDYFRLDPADTRFRLAELVEEGALEPVTVEGWRRPAYLDPAARKQRRAQARALVSPFDPLVWERDRAERLFGFIYRLEIYTPVPLRQHGYYVLPLVLGDRLAARVDLKADRGTGRLLVQAAHLEPGGDADQVAAALADELQLLARWLGLVGVEVGARGSLVIGLARALKG